MTEIYATNIESGGSGKTSITANGAMYLGEKKKKKVLLMDCNHQCDLTDRMIKHMAHFRGLNYLDVMANLDEDKHTVKGIFSGNNSPVKFSITDNVDLIAGYSELDSLTQEVEKGLQRKALLIWYKRHQEALSEYDYILIDTPNDKSIFTINALVLADYVLGVVDVDETTLQKVDVLKKQIDFLKTVELMPNLESIVSAKVKVVGNKFEVGKNAPTPTKQFVKKFKDLMEKEPDTYLGFFEDRLPIARFKTSGEFLVDLEKKKHGQKQSEKDFYKRTWALYDKIFGL